MGFKGTPRARGARRTKGRREVRMAGERRKSTGRQGKEKVGAAVDFYEEGKETREDQLGAR